MKRILYLISGLLLLSACEQDVVYKVDYNVTLDPENTYYAGEPVKFNFTGDVDNLLFFSGELGHMYEFKDRREVALEDVAKIDLALDIQARYGYPGLTIYISDSFDGLNGPNGGAGNGSVDDNAAADMKILQEMAEAEAAGTMDQLGWTKLEYKDGASQQWTHHIYSDIEKFKENFCIAFHFKPEKRGTNAQRSYWVNGALKMQFGSVGQDGEIENLTGVADMNFAQMEWTSVIMHKEQPDPYYKNGGDACVDFNKSDAPLIFQGASDAKWPTQIDLWCISTPSKLNKVSNDVGTVVKNMQNYMDSFEYTWNEPGTYKVSFLGINANYAGTSKELHEFTVNIFNRTPVIDRPSNE